MAASSWRTGSWRLLSIRRAVLSPSAWWRQTGVTALLLLNSKSFLKMYAENGMSVQLNTQAQVLALSPVFPVVYRETISDGCFGEPICFVWRRPPILGCLGCDGLPPSDEVRTPVPLHVVVISQASGKVSSDRVLYLGRLWWWWCVQRRWWAREDCGALWRSLWGSVGRALSPRRLSWMPHVLTSSSRRRFSSGFLNRNGSLLFQILTWNQITKVILTLINTLPYHFPGGLDGITQVPEGGVSCAGAKPQRHLWDPVWPPAETHSQEHILGLGPLWGVDCRKSGSGLRPHPALGVWYPSAEMLETFRKESID